MIEFLKRPLAVTDVETTGFDPQVHEVIEIGLIVVDQKTLKVLDEFEAKVRPRRIRAAAEQALKINGYNKLDWLGAADLEDAMKIYSKKTKQGIFTAHNSYLDWAFISEAFKSTGVEDYTDYHRVDLFSLAWGRAKKLRGLKKFHLKSLCEYFGLEPEPLPHRALNGARKALEVLKLLMKV